MSRRFTIRVDGLERLLAKMGGAAIIRDEMRKAFDRAGFIVESEAKRLVPVDRGRLRASIAHQVDPATFPKHAEVGTNTSYAKAVHDGRPRGIMPPVSALEGWAKRHRMSAWAVAKAIEQRGIPARPFLADALEAKQPAVQAQFDKALERMRNAWGR